MSKKSDCPKNQRIQVFARCRPLNSREIKLGTASMMQVLPEKNKLVLKDRNTFREYLFDQVFSADAKQVTVYEAVVEPLIQEVIMGYSCTVFAYGQTGTGKTYTMEGERSDSKCSWKDDPSAGIIPRSLHQLYEELNQAKNVEFSVKVSFLEIYNEEVYDLLTPPSDFTKLHIYEDCSLKDSVKIRGLEEVHVKSKDEVYTILEKGTAKRHTAETKLNVCSSRSHTVFSVMVNIIEKTSTGGKIEKSGKLNLVDLAGSENVGRSGAIDKRAREAGNINQSLLTLGRVITALIEKQAHVPYRESKLTRILQDSLNGHAKTTMIATISPALCSLNETVSTLEYAAKAKLININPELNKKILCRGLVKELKKENDRLRMENENLMKDLAAARSNQGFFVDAENYESMKQNITAMDKEIEALKAENLKLHQEAALAASDIESLHAKIRRTQNVAYTNEDICDGLRKLSEKQCADLYDMVADYSKERVKFSQRFKEDQDRLSHELSEYRKKTNFLYEKLSNELQLVLDGVLRHLKEQANSESQRANDLSQDLIIMKDSFVSKFADFLKLRLPSLLDELNVENALIEDWISNIHMSMKEKVNQLINVVNNQTTEERKQLCILKNVLASFFMNYDAAIVNYSSRIQSFKEEKDNLSNIFAMVKEKMNTVLQFKDISEFEESTFRLRSVQVPLDMLDELFRTTEQEVMQFGNIADEIKYEEFFQKRRSNIPFCHKMTNTMDDFKKSIFDISEKASVKIESCNSKGLGNVEVKNCLENGFTSISNIIDKAHLEDKSSIQMDHLGKIFEESEESYTDAASHLQGAILEKDSDMEKYISEAFVRDVPTGTTPQQKSFQSPRHSRVTLPYGLYSPFRLVKNRINTTLKENDESNCMDSSSFLNSEDISEVSIDVYDSDGCESDFAVEPEIHFDDNNKVSNKENVEVVKLTKWKSIRFPSRLGTSEEHLKASPLSTFNNTNSKVDEK